MGINGYLVVFTLPSAGAHRVHPEVGVHLVGADAGVCPGGHGRGSGVHRRPGGEERQREPYPPREQHPPHGQGGDSVHV